MDPQEDYPSDSDASDEDFRPDKEEGSGSELESDDNVDDHENGDDEPEAKTGGKKRKRAGKKVSKKKAKVEAVQEKQTEKKDEDLDEDDEEQLTDALWADFLAGSNSSTSGSSKEPAKKSAAPSTKTQKPVEKAKPETITKIFEFAGETVEVTEPAAVPSAATVEPKSAPKPATLGALSSNGSGLPRPPLGGRSSGGGLGAVLGQIGKKNKLSVLEKTQLDWKKFKHTEGIEEELQTHNRGRDGYLERQDFLQRADVRQFEIEKNFRQSKSKR